MAAVIGEKGTELNLLIKQGSTFSFVTEITDANGLASDLRDTTFSGQIRKAYNSAAISASFSITLEGLNKLTFTLTPMQTGALSAGDYEYDPKSEYVWDCEGTENSGRVYPLFFGAVNVFREVTR